MNAASIVSLVNNVVDMAQRFLPLIHSGDTKSIDAIIDTVQSMAPLITEQIGDTYTGVKNIIDAIGSHPATTEAQLASLATFSAKVDADWNAIESKLDPDNPANA
jgi:hypothetical protein